MRTILILAALLAGCATTPKPQSPDPAAQKALGERIDRICSLPAEERAAELEKLKKETGMALLCGSKPTE